MSFTTIWARHLYGFSYKIQANLALSGWLAGQVEDIIAPSLSVGLGWAWQQTSKGPDMMKEIFDWKINVRNFSRDISSPGKWKMQLPFNKPLWFRKPWQRNRRYADQRSLNCACVEPSRDPQRCHRASATVSRDWFWRNFEQRPLGSWRHFSTKLHEFWLKELQKTLIISKCPFLPTLNLKNVMDSGAQFAAHPDTCSLLSLLQNKRCFCSYFNQYLMLDRSKL